MSDPAVAKLYPRLETNRLVLRKFVSSDASHVQRLAGVKEIAQYTSIPHPYEDGMAESWIETRQEEHEAGRITTFAVTRKEDDQLIGCVGLRLNPVHNTGALGYWVGVPFWGKGYCTEAARAVLEYGFDELQLHRIYAEFMGTNIGSGKVMQKLGMQQEGRLREHFDRYGEREDSVMYGILRHEYHAQ